MLSGEFFDDCSIPVSNGYVERHLAGQGMGGAGLTGVEGAECHFNAVQETFADISPSDEPLCCLLDGQ